MRQDFLPELATKESTAEALAAGLSCMFDPKQEKLLIGLQKMIAKRIETAKKSPYHKD